MCLVFFQLYSIFLCCRCRFSFVIRMAHAHSRIHLYTIKQFPQVSKVTAWHMRHRTARTQSTRHTTGRNSQLVMYIDKNKRKKGCGQSRVKQLWPNACISIELDRKFKTIQSVLVITTIFVIIEHKYVAIVITAAVQFYVSLTAELMT